MKESQAYKPNPKKPDESKLKKVAKKFGKYLTTAALASALTLNPLSFGVGKKELIKEKPSIELVKKAYAEEKEELPVVPLSEVLASKEETEKLIKEGKVEEVKFRRALIDTIKVKEWTIETVRLPYKSSSNPAKVGLASKAKITNEYAAPDDATVFVTNSIWDLATELGIMDHELVVGYVVQRPDDPSQSVLILAHKNHLNFYVLNDKGEIEWIPVILNKDDKPGRADLKISKKPEVIIYGHDEDEDGKHIIVVVFDEEIKYKTNGSAKLMIVNFYPKPNKQLVKDAQSAPGVFVAKIDLAK